MRTTQDIIELDKFVHQNLASQTWPKSINSRDYFNSKPQGRRFDDEIYHRLVKFVLPEVKTILDIGAGEGKLAQELSKNGCFVTCIEPSVLRFETLKKQGFSSFNYNFENFNSSNSYDCCISLRSIGVCSKIGESFGLHETLKKMIKLAKSQLIIVSKAIEDKHYVIDDYHHLSIYQKKAWLYHYQMLKLMGFNPSLDYIPIDVCKPYQSIEECIEKDFWQDNLKLSSDYLTKYTFIKENIIYRKTRLLFPIVDLHLMDNKNFK